MYQFAPNVFGWIDPLGLIKELVYRLTDNKGQTIYYGITNDAERRCGEHRSKKQFGKMEILAENLTHDEARTIEGALIRAKIGKAPSNQPILAQLKKANLLNKNRGRTKERWADKRPLSNWKDKFLSSPKMVEKSKSKCSEKC